MNSYYRKAINSTFFENLIKSNYRFLKIIVFNNLSSWRYALVVKLETMAHFTEINNGNSCRDESKNNYFPFVSYW